MSVSHLKAQVIRSGIYVTVFVLSFFLSLTQSSPSLDIATHKYCAKNAKWGCLCFYWYYTPDVDASFTLDLRYNNLSYAVFSFHADFIIAYNDFKKFHIYTSSSVSLTVALFYINTRPEKEGVHLWTYPSSLSLPASTFSVPRISTSLSV